MTASISKTQKNLINMKTIYKKLFVIVLVMFIEVKSLRKKIIYPCESA